MDDTKLVCNCTGVTVGDIREAVQNGAKTFDELQEATGVSTVCGQCRDYAENVFNAIMEGE